MLNKSYFCRLSVAIAALGILTTCCLAQAEPPTVKFSKRCLMINLNEGCAIADINHDGKPDIVAGTHWYAGPDFIPRPLREIPETKDHEYLASNGDQVYDVDGDGWLDVISIDFFEPEMYWYKNPGTEKLRRGLLWERHLLKVTNTRNEAIELRDFDGDGVPEIFVNCWDKKAPLVVWKLIKTPKGEFTLEQHVVGEQGGGHGYAFGDVNGDGREDILCELGWYERPEGNPFAKPWKFHTDTALPHPSCPFLVAKLTDSGRNDLIWAKGHDYGIYWWEQGVPKPDGTTTWTEHLIDNSWSQPHCLVWADIDGDGQPELITGKRARAHGEGDPGGKEPECMYYYHWDKAARQFTRHTISPPGGGIGGGLQICVADLNGDGRPDIAVAGKTGTWVLINEGLKK